MHAKSGFAVNPAAAFLCWVIDRQARRGLQQEDRLPRSSSVSRGTVSIIKLCGKMWKLYIQRFYSFGSGQSAWGSFFSIRCRQACRHRGKRVAGALPGIGASSRYHKQNSSPMSRAPTRCKSGATCAELLVCLILCTSFAHESFQRVAAWLSFRACAAG